jgi:hypothetical protein
VVVAFNTGVVYVAPVAPAMLAPPVEWCTTAASGGSQFYDATTGTIVVSTVSATNISGTFTFTGTASSGSTTKTVTNGKFNVKL